jgi:hypothetical protein
LERLQFSDMVDNSTSLLLCLTEIVLCSLCPHPKVFVREDSVRQSRTLSSLTKRFSGFAAVYGVLPPYHLK